MRTMLYVIGLLLICGCGCPNGISLEDAMDNCDTVSELETLKRTCFVNFQQAEEINARKRKLYAEQNPQLPSHIKNYLLNGKICVGMTKEQVLVSWGRRPSDINKTVGSWGVNEQWVYGGIHFGHYLYFDDGILTSWQEHKDTTLF